MSTGVNYNFEITAKKVSFVIDGAIVGWVNASGLDCNSSKIANLGTPTLAADGANKSYVDTLDGQNVKLTGDQTITGIKIFNGSRNDVRALNLLSQADFNNVDIINGGNITYNGARILNQNGGDIFFSQTTGDWQSFLYTLNTDASGTADQRGYLFTNVAFDVKGAGLYISKLLDNKSASSGIVRFNNSGGMKFYGGLDMNSNNITNGGTITGTTLTATAGMTTTTLTASDNIVVGAGKKIFVDRNANANNKLVVFDGNNNSTTEFQGFGTANATLIYNIPAANSHVFYVSGTTELFRINNTTITASKSITANAGITYSGVLTTASASTNGAKIAIQGQTDGTNARGIFMWDIGDSNWGIYMSQSGANKSLSGGTAPAGGVGGGLTSYAIRFRVNNSSTSGFIWENSSNTALMSLKASDGQLWVLSNPIQYSDRRKKEDIKDCLGLDFINKLNPVCYRMIDDKKKCRTGLIAQELEDILEEMNMLDFGGFIKEKIMVPCPKQRKEYELKGVSINPEDVKCIDSGDVGYGIGYSEFIAPLIKAVQQLSEKVINLEKQNKILLNILQDQTNA